MSAALKSVEDRVGGEIGALVLKVCVAQARIEELERELARVRAENERGRETQPRE